MVHMMCVAFNQSGLLCQEPKRHGLCISIKLLDEGARSLLLLFCSRYCLLAALPPKISSSALLPETAQRPPAGRSAEQLYLGSPLSRLFVPPRRISRKLQEGASPGWESHSLPHHSSLCQQRFPVSAPIAPHTHTHTLGNSYKLRGWKVDANNSFCARQR